MVFDLKNSKIRCLSHVYQELLRSCGSQELLGLKNEENKRVENKKRKLILVQPFLADFFALFAKCDFFAKISKNVNKS
jgi:hypothetical protein